MQERGRPPRKRGRRSSTRTIYCEHMATRHIRWHRLNWPHKATDLENYMLDLGQGRFEVGNIDALDHQNRLSLLGAHAHVEQACPARHEEASDTAADSGDEADVGGGGGSIRGRRLDDLVDILLDLDPGGHGERRDALHAGRLSDLCNVDLRRGALLEHDEHGRVSGGRGELQELARERTAAACHVLLVVDGQRRDLERVVLADGPLHVVVE
eukprot:1998619-Rhodomonas_salina.1